MFESTNIKETRVESSILSFHQGLKRFRMEGNVALAQFLANVFSGLVIIYFLKRLSKGDAGYAFEHCSFLLVPSTVALAFSFLLLGLKLQHHLDRGEIAWEDTSVSFLLRGHATHMGTVFTGLTFVTAFLLLGHSPAAFPFFAASSVMVTILVVMGLFRMVKAIREYGNELEGY